MGRASILKSIEQNKPAIVPLPDIDLHQFEEDLDLVETFKEKVTLVGGNLRVLAATEELDSVISNLYPDSKRIISTTKESSLGTVTISKETEPHTLENVDLSIIMGVLGVAENGSIWIDDENTVVRVLPFITNDLILLLKKEDLCLHLHEAYRLIANRKQGYGLFLSGPSKTADIEQCLVIGAQGAMSLTVILI